MCLLYLPSRSSLRPPGSCPHARLKASTPHEAPTSALTMKTLVPTTAYQHSARSEATRRAPTFKTVAMRVHGATPEAPVSTQRGDASAEQPSWSLGTPLLHFKVVTLGPTVGLQDCSGETCSLSEDQQLGRQQVVPSATRQEHNRESLPHSRRPCKQWGCPLSMWMVHAGCVFVAPFHSCRI